MNRPKITVVMPVYNAARYLAQSIESVLKQDLGSFELVIYDDGSKDLSYRIAKSYRRKDSRIRVYRGAQKRGVAYARNRIIDLARGQYLALHDADDIMLAGRLEKQAAVLDRFSDVGLVVGKAFVLDERLKKITGVQCSGVRTKKRVTFFNETGRIRCFSWAPNCTAMLRKEAVLKAGGYNENMKLASDADLFERLWGKTAFYFINSFFYVYREHSKSLTAKRTRSRHEKSQ